MANNSYYEAPVEEAIESIDEDCYPDIITLACKMLSYTTNGNRTETRILFDLVEACHMDDVKEAMINDYKRQK